MSLKEHTAYGAVVAALLYPLLGASSIFFLAGAVLIDIDHYLDYLYHNRLTDLSPRRMFSYHRLLAKSWHRPDFLNLSIFHTAEVLLPLFIASYHFGSLPLKALAFGMVFHIVLDMIALYREGIFFSRSYFIADYFLRKRLLRLRGLDTTALYTEAAKRVRTEGGYT